jgi:hypothetical protein
MSEISDEQRSWYEGLYRLPNATPNILKFVIPGTNLEYLMDKADKAITPLFDDPKEYRAIHVMFRQLVNEMFNKTRCTRVYLCKSEQDSHYEKVA